MALVFACGSCGVIYLLFPPPPLTVLITGVDARPGEGLQTRTDSIMLANINPPRLQVSLLSIPRDLFITVPGYGLQRINTVNVLGEQEAVGRGNTLLMEGIAESFGFTATRYARLDYNGFVRLVDAVGGVTIDVPHQIVDTLYPTEDGGVINVQFEPGIQHMDGETALKYARTRQADDDYRRAARQQQIVNALARKLINPLNWVGAIGAISTAINTNLNVFDMALYAPVVLVNAGRFETRVIEREDITTTSDGLVVPNYQRLDMWLAEHFR
jgi:LCP family protein required for cell wall assembly